MFCRVCDADSVARWITFEVGHYWFIHNVQLIAPDDGVQLIIHSVGDLRIVDYSTLRCAFCDTSCIRSVRDCGTI